MTIELGTADVDDLGGLLTTLGEWQRDEAPLQLHPGDVAWYWRFGAVTTAASVRTWHRDGRLVALGLLDGPRMLRVAFAPGEAADAALADQMAQDIALSERGVLPSGQVALEVPTGALVHEVLGEYGWQVDEPWTPLRRDLTEPLPRPGVRVETVDRGRVSDRTAVQRAVFGGSTFTDDRWRTMAAGPGYADARCLVAYDEDDVAVAAVTVWSAGPGRPGLIEPMGVHPEHRGRGYGTAITLAGAAALRDLGSSSALVCTPTSNAGGVATYVAAGFRAQPQRFDRRRDAEPDV